MIWSHLPQIVSVKPSPALLSFQAEAVPEMQELFFAICLKLGQAYSFRRPLPQS
jgi:hypothetical protein